MLLMSGLLACGALLIAPTPQLNPQAGDEPPTVVVEAHFVDEPEPAIAFEVRSPTRQAVFESDLPWGNFYSVRLAFRSAAGKRVCPLLRQPIDDPSDTRITMQPDEARRGMVPLLPYCPALAELRARGPLTVVWIYTPVGRSVKGKPTRGGVIVPSAE